jgi:hypothetical protein
MQEAYGQKMIHLKGMQKIVSIEVDAKGQYFLADEAHTLFKLDSLGNIMTQVNTKLYGGISLIDVTNPFEIYTYHQEQNVLVYYDNMLNVRGKTYLNSLGLTNVASICRSFDNGFWVFDLMEFKLVRMDKRGNVLASSNNLINILQLELNPYKIIEHDKRIYLCDSVNGIFVFDIFGTYIKTIFSKSNNNAFVNKNIFYVLENDKIFGIHLQLKIPFKEVLLPSQYDKIVGINNRNIYLLLNGTIFIIPHQ